jgi:hypothetical protein
MPVHEIWLLPNRRVYAVGMVAMILLGGNLLAVAAITAMWQWYVAAGMSVLWAIVSFWMAGTFVTAMRRPRLAYGEDQLWVYLDPRQPVKVPIEIVECFFLGQGPSFVTGGGKKEAETQNVIVRLAESAVDWKHRDVPDKLGHWCEGYITLRGAWCEPITKDRMQALNRRLAEVHRERKAKAADRLISQEQPSA